MDNNIYRQWKTFSANIYLEQYYTTEQVNITNCHDMDGNNLTGG